MIKIFYDFVTINKEEVLSKFNNTDKIEGIILDTRKINLSYYPNLKAISRVGVGVDNIDHNYCENHGIKVFTTPCKELFESVAQHTLLLILSMLKKNKELLCTKTVGIIGYGRIGSKVDFYLRNLCKSVYIYDKIFSSQEARLNLLKNSDIITIHISGRERVIGKKELELMKNGSYLVNTAREGCISQQAVFCALGSDKLIGFATDVDNFYYNIFNRIIKTDHIASNSIESRMVMERMAVNQLDRYLNE